MLIDGFTLFGSWPGLPYDHPLEHLLAGLERHKLDRVCTLSTQGIFFDAAAGNAFTWEACKQDPRLIPIGVADPRIGGLEQVDFCKQQGFPLMALFPVTQGWSFNNLAARVVLRRIAEANLPVLIEASREGEASAIIEAAHGLTMPIILLDVSLHTLSEVIAVIRSRTERSPYLDVLRAPISEAVSLLRGGPEIYLATRLLSGGDTIEYLSQTIGANRLIFTSQFPISCFSSAFLTARFANIDDEARANIMGENMLRLLG